MAEFPTLGRHCELDTCKQLDFTPFFCSKCNKSYCTNHRLSHGCLDDDNVIDPKDAKKIPMNIFLCSFKNCNKKTSTRIDCVLCGANFCLGEHKNPEGHECPKFIRPTINKATLSKAVEDQIANEKEKSKDSVKVVKTKKVMTQEERGKYEKINAMKLKLRASKIGISRGEIFVLFATSSDQSIYGALVSNAWMFGRAIHELKTQNSDLVLDEKANRFFKEDGSEICFGDGIKNSFTGDIGRVYFK